jgi:hypothetical protein
MEETERAIKTDDETIRDLTREAESLGVIKSTSAKSGFKYVIRKYRIQLTVFVFVILAVGITVCLKKFEPAFVMIDDEVDKNGVSTKRVSWSKLIFTSILTSACLVAVGFFSLKR